MLPLLVTPSGPVRPLHKGANNMRKQNTYNEHMRKQSEYFMKPKQTATQYFYSVFTGRSFKNAAIEKLICLHSNIINFKLTDYFLIKVSGLVSVTVGKGRLFHSFIVIGRKE